ncbi:MAG: hypothetical protein H0X24_00045 [Ktedonobacterales bacterium]|nr:hypothetical protein [Ktedonobacterales bacterium]
MPDPIAAMLTELRTHGFSPQANGGQGGLALRWANRGTPQVISTTALDADGNLLSDARYVLALWLATQHHPDAALLAERNRYTAILKAVVHVAQGASSEWFAVLHALGALSGDVWYEHQTTALVTWMAHTLYHPASGAIYWVDPTHPKGWYRTADALEVSAALVIAGKQQGTSAWVQAGIHALAFIETHAYLPVDHLYFGAMMGVLTASGQINPNELLDQQDAPLTSSAIARDALALAKIGQATGDATSITQAANLLNSVSPDRNALKLWDDTYVGYNQSLTFSGEDYAHPGVPNPPQATKSPATQAWMLLAFTQVSDAAGDQDVALTSALQQCLLTRAYQPARQGIVALMTPDWGIGTGEQASWDDSATMTLALVSLLGSSSGGAPSPPAVTTRDRRSAMREGGP